MSMGHDSQKCNFKVALSRVMTDPLMTVPCDPVRDGRDGASNPDALHPGSGGYTAPGLL